MHLSLTAYTACDISLHRPDKISLNRHGEISLNRHGEKNITVDGMGFVDGLGCCGTAPKLHCHALI